MSVGFYDMKHPWVDVPPVDDGLLHGKPCPACHVERPLTGACDTCDNENPQLRLTPAEVADIESQLDKTPAIITRLHNLFAKGN